MNFIKGFGLVFKALILIICIVSISACAKYSTTTPNKILIKTGSEFSFLDTGFIDTYSNKTVVKLFSTSQIVSTITLGSKACIDNTCMSYERFNKKFLYKYYPPKILKNIIEKKPIYNEKNIAYNNGGFVQNINLNNIKIEYKVNSKETYFIDFLNKIKIKISLLEK